MIYTGKCSSFSKILIIGLFAILSGSSIIFAEPTVVESVDLERYQGQWFEIARFSNPFQTQLQKNVTATYTQLENGYIEIVNACTNESGQTESVLGLAKVIDTNTNAKLGVSFFEVFGWRPIWGDYWIIGLDKEYKFAVIGDSNSKFGWVLSRTKKLSKKQLTTVLSIFATNGYDSAALTYTVHNK
ncbi:lipocalin family protein [bacterium]|jgi:apolipoprotein D and lipocalin family protein|nr:lipocalin family protein [bacterium]